MAKAKILIVEDDPFSVQLLRHNLKTYPAEILPVASTAEEALKIALEHEPDVALVDIYLSGESDGLEAARAIQEHYDIPIIYLTGYSSDEVFENAKATDPFGYILKPFTPKELTVTLDMALYKHAIAKELKHSKAVLSTTLESLSEAVITADEEGKIVYANPVAVRWLGAKPGDKLTERVSLTQAGQPIGLDEKTFASAKGPVCELKTLQGELKVRIGVYALPKSTPGTTVVVWDVTQEYATQKQAQDVLAAMESLEEGLLLLDPQTQKILFASRGFEKMTGWKAADAVGEGPAFLFGTKNAQEFWRHAQEELAKNGFVKAECALVTQAGKELLVQWQISKMKTGGEEQLMVFLRDVSLNRQMEEELRQSQKIEAVGRLAGGVAHDFNNLLSVINSYADLMTLKVPEGDPLLKYIGNIRTAGQRAAELVGKLLTFSRRDSAKPVMLDVKSLTDDIHRMLRRVIPENIDIKLTYGEGLGSLWADQLQIEQILMNLCVNARDAIKGAGKINVAWQMQSVEGTIAAEKQLTPGNYLVLSVADTGSGIEPAVKERIFEPYFTTKTAGKGTGLGLSIVYGVVKQLKGAIEVDSTVGEGTTFRLYFPASERPAAVRTTSPMVQPPAQGDEHILVVEDEETFAECLQNLLSLHGYKVHHAKDMTAAMQIFDSALYPIKLLISDVVLPGASGQTLAATLKQKDPQLKVIFITGYDNALQVLQDFPHTALVLQKPFSVVSILNKIREVLDNQQNDRKIQII